MRRRLRLLAALLLFAALPPLLGHAAFTDWLDAREAELEEAALDTLAAALRDLNDDAFYESDRRALAAAALEALSREEGLTAEGERAAQAALDRMAPGVARVVALKAAGHPGAYSFVTVDPEADPAYAIFAAYLRRREAKWNAPDLTAAETRLVAKRIVGARSAPQIFAYSRGAPLPVRREGRDGTLQWDFVGGRETPRGLAMVFVDDERYRTAFGTETLLARAARGLPPDARLGLVDTGDTSAHATAAAFDPELPGRLRRGLGALDRFRTARHLVALLPDSREPSRIFYALRPRERIMPERGRLARTGALLALLFAVAAAALVVAHTAGRFHLFIPLRAQFVILFVLSTLVPLWGALRLGSGAIRTGRAVDEAERLAQIREKIAGIEERANDAIHLHENRCRALFRHERGRAFDVDWLAKRLRDYNRDLSDRYRGMPGNESDSAPLNDFYILDSSARIVAERWSDRSHNAVRSLLVGVGERILEAVNGAASPRERRPASRDEIADTLLAMDTGMIDGLVRRRGKLEIVQFLGIRTALIVDALLDAEGRGTGAVILVFHDWELERRAAWAETALNGPGTADGIELVAAHRMKPSERFPSPERFSPDLERLVERAANEPQPVQGWVTRGKERFLACAARVPGFKDFIVAGLVPRERLDAPWRTRERAMTLLVLLSLLVAVACALVVSSRFVEPIRRFDRALGSVTAGDLSVRLPADGDDEMAGMAETFNRMVEGLDEKERMSRYVSDFVRSAVKGERGPGGLEAGATLEATVLFSDIRGFTTLTERHPPSEIVRMLNEYLDLMTRCIKASGGVIDRFIGDAVKAVFHPIKGAPRDDAARAVTAALAMRAELSRYNERRRAEGVFEIENGIGINTGPMVMGTIGDPEVRLDLTVVGAEVERAGALESASKRGRHTRIVLSEATREAVSALVVTEPLDADEAGPCHEVVGPRRAADYLPDLAGDDPEARARAARLIALTGDPDAVPALAGRLADPSPEVRFAAAAAMRAFPERRAEALAALLGSLDREPDPRVRAAIVAAAGSLAGPESLGDLERALADPDARVRANAVEALAGLPSERLLPLLRPLLADPNNRLRANVCVALFTHGALEAVDALLAMTRDPSPLMRASGAWGLSEVASRGRRGGPDAARLISEPLFRKLDEGIDALHALIADPDPMVARNAARGLGRIGCRRSIVRLVEAFRETADPALKAVFLAALEEAGSVALVRGLKEESAR